MTRGAKPSLDPTAQVCIKMSQKLVARLDLHLFSELEGRVPKGKYKEFFTARVREFFEWRRLELGAFGFPPGYFIAGPKEMIEALEKQLQATERTGYANPLYP